MNILSKKTPRAKYIMPFTVCGFEPGIVLIVSAVTGDLFAFYDSGIKYEIGQAVAVLLDNNGTGNNIADDCIIAVG